MKNMALRLSLIILISLVPFSAFAQPSMSELSDCYQKIMAFRKDLIDLAGYSQGGDRNGAIGLIKVASEYSDKIDHLRDLLLIVKLLRNTDDRNRVTPVVYERMKQIAQGIDLSLQEVNLEISHVRGNAIVSTGNQMKTELRKLQTLLSLVSKQ